MRFRQLGHSGLTVSAVGLGCNNFGGRIDDARARSVIDAALDSGITLFDTADIYGSGGSERIIGEALGDRRDRVVLATKFGSDMHYKPEMARGSRRYIRYAVEQSLRRLRTDWIDLYQLHTPDPLTPIEETLEALTELVHEGKLRYIGSSNFSGWQIADAEHLARNGHLERFVSAQNHYSLLERDVEREVVPACAHFEVGLLPFFPLASGLLTGKYRRGQPAPQGTRLAANPERLEQSDFDTVERLTNFASERGHTLLALAFAGLLAEPVVSSVIAGATTPDQIAANVEAGDWDLNSDDVAALRRCLSGAVRQTA